MCVCETHHNVLECLDHPPLEGGALELQHDAEGDEDGDARHARGAQDGKEQHVTLTAQPVQP